MAFVTAKDGTKLFYNDWGTGRPIVLIHGWPLSSDMWEYQATNLALQGFRVIAYDRRGFGRSDQPWQSYDYDTLADDLAAVLEARNVSDAMLVGFSMGGGEVVRYMTRQRGARVSKCALVSSVTPYLLKTDDNPEGVDIGVFDKMLQGLEKDRPAFLASFGKQFFGDSVLSPAVSNEVLQWTSQLALQASAEATRVCVRSFSQTDFRADVVELKVPTLVIHGDADKTVPIDAAGRRVAKLIRGAELVEYEGAPHGLYMTHKDRLTEDLMRFAR